MSNPANVAQPPFQHRPSPPSKHQLALMIWLSVFPTLTVINLALGDWLVTLPPLLRTLVLTTVAVPIVIYGLMPLLHKGRARLITRSANNEDRVDAATQARPKQPNHQSLESPVASPLRCRAPQ